MTLTILRPTRAPRLDPRRFQLMAIGFDEEEPIEDRAPRLDPRRFQLMAIGFDEEEPIATSEGRAAA